MPIKNKFWASKFDECIVCKTMDKKHYAKGLCVICYYRKRFKENTHYRKVHLKCCKDWRKRNEKRWRKINLKAVKKHYKKKRLDKEL